MAKRRRTTRRAVKRSAKRSAKRGAYKSRKTHLKSRGRTQRGGEGWKDKVEAAARDKAAAATELLKEKFYNFTENVSAATMLMGALNTTINVFITVANAIFSLMVMGLILATVASNPREFATAASNEMKNKVSKQFATLKEKMKELIGDNERLNGCINLFENGITSGTITIQQDTSNTSDVGKTCIYSPGIATEQGPAKSYQALIVGEWDQAEAEAEAEENVYGQPMYLIWVNGGGLNPDRVFKNTIKIVSNEKDKGEFTKLANNRIGQQKVTMEQAREFYGLNQIPESSLDENTTPVQTNQTDSDEQNISGNLFVRKFTSLIRELRGSPDKKKFVIDAFEGFVAVSKSKLNRLINGVVSDKDKDKDKNNMKLCIIELKDFLKEKIKKQIELLRNPANGKGDITSASSAPLESSEPSEPSASSAPLASSASSAPLASLASSASGLFENGKNMMSKFTSFSNRFGG